MTAAPLLSNRPAFCLWAFQGSRSWSWILQKVRATSEAANPAVESTLIGSFTVAVVLAVRTYAVWKSDKRVGIGLALLLGLSQIPDMILLKRFIQGIGCEYPVDPLPPPRSTSPHASTKPFRPRRTESISGDLPGMLLYQSHEACFRNLGDNYNRGRRYFKYHLMSRALTNQYRNGTVQLALMIISAVKTSQPLPDVHSLRTIAHRAEQTVDPHQIS